jgi:hypothetical protein
MRFITSWVNKSKTICEYTQIFNFCQYIFKGLNFKREKETIEKKKTELMGMKI